MFQFFAASRFIQVAKFHASGKQQLEKSRVFSFYSLLPPTNENEKGKESHSVETYWFSSFLLLLFCCRCCPHSEWAFFFVLLGAFIVHSFAACLSSNFFSRALSLSWSQSSADKSRQSTIGATIWKWLPEKAERYWILIAARRREECGATVMCCDFNLHAFISTDSDEVNGLVSRLRAFHE